mgnify:CR=1 FL=1
MQSAFAAWRPLRLLFHCQSESDWLLAHTAHAHALPITIFLIPMHSSVDSMCGVMGGTRVPASKFAVSERTPYFKGLGVHTHRHSSGIGPQTEWK